MKKIIFILLSFISIHALAQRVPGYTRYFSKTQVTGIIHDSTNNIPWRDTIVDPVVLGEVRIRPQDSLIYIAVCLACGEKWKSLSGIDSTRWVTTTLRRADSVFVVKGGIEYFAYIDSSGITTISTATDVDTSGIADGDVLVWDSTAGKYKLVPQSSGIDSLQSQYSIVGSGKASNKFRLANDSSISENTTPLAYQYVNGRPGFYAVKADTADIFGIDSSTTFANVTELRATQLYNKGARYALTMGYTTRNDGGGTRYIWNTASTAADDGKFVFKPDAIDAGSPGRWEWMAKGVVRAAEVGVKSDGTDQTSTLNSLFALSTVKDVLFDNGDVKITGKVDAQGKTATLENNARIIGAIGNADTLTNVLIKADLRTAIFDTSLTVINLHNSVISVRWFGAVADLHYTGSVAAATDNKPMFVKALKAGRELFPGTSQYSIKTKVYIPAGASGYMYRFASYLPEDYGVELYGDGRQQSVLYFGAASKGIWVRYYSDSTNGSQYPYLHDFKLVGTYGGSSANYYDSTSHGLTINTVGGRYERLDITNFDGDGINLHGNVPTNNANNNHFYDIKSYGNGGNGFLASGGDANAFDVQDCDFSGNAIAGAFDNSFLGGTFLNCHTASNGYQHPKNRSSVADSTGLYWCIADNNNIHPGVTAGWQNYWYRVADAPNPTYSDAFWHRWDSTLSTTYVKAAGYIANGANQLSGFFSCYSESDEFASINNGNAIFINGYAAQFGSMGGSLGMKQGIPTMREFQVYDQGSSSGSDDNIYLRLDSRARKLSWVHGSMNFGMKYDTTNKLIGWAEGGLGASGFFVSAPGFSPIFLGRASTLAYGTPISVVGYASSNIGGSGYRTIGVATTIPTSGEYATGDYLVNTDATRKYITGWKCVSGGTPGTWQPNFTTLAGTTGARPSPASTEGGVLYFNTDSSKVQAWSGTAWVTMGGGSGGTTSPGGSDTYVQFNDGGAFGGDAKLRFDKTAGELRINGIADQGSYSLQSKGNVAITEGQLELSSGTSVGSGGNTAFVIKGIGSNTTSGYGELTAYYAGVDYTAPLALQTNSAGSVVVGRTSNLSGYKFLVNADHGKMGHIGVNSSIYDFDIGTTGSGYSNGGRVNFKGAASTVASIQGTYHTSNVGEIKFTTLSGGDFYMRGTNFLAPTSAYYNFGTTSGSTGYGIRDNAGTMQYKNSGGGWTDIGSGGGITGSQQAFDSLVNNHQYFTNAGDLDTVLTHPNDSTLAWKSIRVTAGTNVTVTPTITDSTINYQIDARSATVRTLSSQYTDAANSGTTETDLMSYTVPANTMTSDGDVIRIEGYFRYALNTNSKTIKINVAGGTLSITLPANTSAGGGSVAISASIIRTSSTAFKFLGLYTPQNGGTPWPLNTSGSSMSWATDVDIQFTGTATSDNDIIQTAMTVTYYPAN